jgi:hypothetical protein
MFDGKSLPEQPARQAWREAVAEIATKAKATLPDCAGRVDRAVQMVLNHAVELLEDGKAKVASQSNGTVVYHLVNGACSCKDYAKAPSNWCKHRIAAGLYKRALALVQRKLAQSNGVSNDSAAATSAPPSAAAQAEAPTSAQSEAPGLPESLKPYVVTLHGKWFVQYAGLLLLAHERGLVSLKAHFISVTPELALAEAEATFADGKTYGECADATPSNVGATVKAHFPRLALTRAKARTLRDALQIGIAALEELADE